MPSFALPEEALSPADAAREPDGARGRAAALARLVLPASRLPAQRAPVGAPRFDLTLLQGRLVTLEGAARLTLACALVRQAQGRGEPALWIGAGAGDFFPPDAAAGGVQLAWLPVVRAGEPTAGLRAAELAVRSGAFGLVVVDVGDAGVGGGGAGVLRAPPLSAQARLSGLAQQHGTAILLLLQSARELTAHGSLFSLGLHGELHPAARAPDGEPGWFVARVQARKDKHGPPGWTDEVPCRGPEGLR